MLTFHRAAVPLAALLLASCPWGAGAQTTHPSQPLGLTAAVDAAWQRALLATEAEASTLRAEASRSVAASGLAAPAALEISRRDGRWAPGSATDRETELAVALPLWQPGQRSAQRALAEAELGLAAAQRAQARWQIAGQVREVGWAVVAARAEHQQWHTQHEGLQQVADDVARRVKAGDLARADALAAQAELLGAQAALADARQRLSEAERRWSLLTGITPPTPEQLAEPSATLANPHPELPLAERGVEQARRQMAHVQASQRDAPELLLRYRQASDAGAPTRSSVGLGLRIPLGGEARNRPLDAQARSALALAERRLDVTRARGATDLADAQQALQTAQARLQMTQTRHALATERAGLIRKAFDAGESGLPELLRALASAAAAHTDLDRSTTALGLARARLAQAQGSTP